MTRAEAIKALEEGHAVTHQYSAEGEFVKQNDSNTYTDGECTFLKSEFWKYRNEEFFDDGWSIVEGK